MVKREFTRSITLWNVRDSTYDKFQKFKSSCKTRGINLNGIFPNLLDEALDNFFKNPDFSKYIDK